MQGQGALCCAHLAPPSRPLPLTLAAANMGLYADTARGAWLDINETFILNANDCNYKGGRTAR